MWGLLTDSGWEGARPVGSPEAPVATSGPQQVLSVLGRHTLGVRWPREGEILLWIFPAFSKVCLGAVCEWSVCTSVGSVKGINQRLIMTEKSCNN